MQNDIAFWYISYKCVWWNLLQIAFLADSIHVVREGFVGIYFLNGALMDIYTMPGIHFSIPFITRVEQIDVRLKTESITPVEASTNDGVTANFNDIQVKIGISYYKIIFIF